MNAQDHRKSASAVSDDVRDLFNISNSLYDVGLSSLGQRISDLGHL